MTLQWRPLAGDLGVKIPELILHINSFINQTPLKREKPEIELFRSRLYGSSLCHKLRGCEQSTKQLKNFRTGINRFSTSVDKQALASNNPMIHIIRTAYGTDHLACCAKTSLAYKTWRVQPNIALHVPEHARTFCETFTVPIFDGLQDPNPTSCSVRGSNRLQGFSTKASSSNASLGDSVYSRSPKRLRGW